MFVCAHILTKVDIATKNYNCRRFDIDMWADVVLWTYDAHRIHFPTKKKHNPERMSSRDNKIKLIVNTHIQKNPISTYLQT